MNSLSLKNFQMAAVLFGIAAFSVVTPTKLTAQLYWDANGDVSAATGGSGAWNTSSSLWRSGSDTGTLGTWSNGNNAFLAGTAGTLTIATGGVSATGLTISTTGYRITGSRLTLTGAPIISVTTGVSTVGTWVTNSSGTAVLAGTAGFTLDGGGELILASGLQSSLSGGVKVTGGSILTAGDRNQPTGSNVNVSISTGVGGFFGGNAVNLDNGTLRIAANSTANSALSGLGTITVNNTGTVNVWRTATSASMSPSLATSVAMSAGSTLAITTGGNTATGPTVTFGNLTASGNFTLQSQNTAIIARMSFGTMNDGGNQMTLLGGGTSTSVTTGPLNGFTATGSSFTGSLVLGNSAGTQGALYAPSSLATTAITTGNITVNRYSQLLVNNTGSFGAAGSTLTLNGIGNQTDAGSGNSGSIRTTASGTTTWLGSTVLGSNTVVSPTTGNTLVLNGNVSGAFQLNKAGSGTLTFNGTNASNTGSTWLTNGTITVNAGSAMGSGALKIGDDSGSNNVTLNLNNSAQAIGTLTQGSASVTRTINLGTSTALTITQTAAGTYGGTITGATGSVSLGASSSNSLTFSASNSYGGGSTISGGTLTLGHATNTLANTGAVLVNGGILNVANPDTVGAVTLSSGSISGAGTLTGSSYALTNIGSVSAILAGTGTLTKTGTGTATISSANTYTGGTTLSGGSLNITNISASATGTGNVVIQDTATLQGSGRIAPTTGGTIIVQDGGTVAIGDLNGTPAQGAKILTITPATGTITTTLQTASTIRFDLFTNAGDNTAITSAADLFRTGGNLTFQDGVILSVNKSGTFSFADGDKWRLLDWTTFSGSITGTSSALTLDLPTLDGLFWDVSALYTNGSISVSGIPEPSRTLFLALGLLTLTLRRRR